ncbi:amidohydrolase [Thermodesulfobacteriota bacterium]
MTDLILHNANILHLNPDHRKNQLVAVQKGRISAVTENERMHEFRDRDTKVIDCKGKTLLPGFIDAHCHLHAYAESLVTISLAPQNNVRSITDIQSIVRSQSLRTRAGSWVRAKGYNEFYLKEKRHPNRIDLDEASTVCPIKLTHRSGHAHMLNSLALKRVGITMETPEPPGGLIDRDLETGEPTGLLYEMGDFLSKRIPPLETVELERGIRLANEELLSLGITSIQDASSHNDLERWETIRSWQSRELFKPRISLMLGFNSFEGLKGKELKMLKGEGRPRFIGVKIILDETTGQLVPSQEELNAMVMQVHLAGLQVAIHAIEESAVETACNAIDYALQRQPRADHRHRIEHCSVCRPSLAKRLSSLGIAVVTQPSFIHFNGDRYLETVPAEQLPYLYPIGTLVKSGVLVAGSSDSPIVPANPLIGIGTALSRRSIAGAYLNADERIPPSEALRMYSENAAWVSFEEELKGSIMPGKLADLVLLDGDPTQVTAEEIKNLSVEMTILNGEVLWPKET